MQRFPTPRQNPSFVAINFFDSLCGKSMLADVRSFQLPYSVQDRGASSMDTPHVEVALRDGPRVFVTPVIIAKPSQNLREAFDVLQRTRVIINSYCKAVT
jgi:hypothetical protein